MNTQDQAAQMSVADMIAQRDAWQARVEAAIAEQKAGVIAELKAKIAAFGLTAADLGLTVTPVVQSAHVPRTRSAGGSRKDRAAPGTGKIPPKYGDNAGNYWTGRGKKPGWVTAIESAGGSMDQYRLSPEQAAAAHAAAQAAVPQAPQVTESPAVDVGISSVTESPAADVVQEQPADTPVADVVQEQAPAVEIPKGAKYTDGHGNFWNGLFRKPDWIQAHLEAGGTLSELEIKQVA